jgi:hypothetical protein
MDSSLPRRAQIGTRTPGPIAELRRPRSPTPLLWLTPMPTVINRTTTGLPWGTAISRRARQRWAACCSVRADIIRSVGRCSRTRSGGPRARTRGRNGPRRGRRRRGAVLRPPRGRAARRHQREGDRVMPAHARRGSRWGAANDARVGLLTLSFTHRDLRRRAARGMERRRALQVHMRDAHPQGRQEVADGVQRRDCSFRDGAVRR